MRPESDNSLPEASAQHVESVRTLTRVLLGVCLAAWAISFLLPAVKLPTLTFGPDRPALGWEIALDALVLLVVPVKGAWLGFLPPLWTVLINVFMLLAPFKLKRIEKGESRVFAVLFSIAAATPVFLAYLPVSLGFLGLGFPLFIGFYLWDFSMLSVAGLFARTLWKNKWSGVPWAVSIGLLLALPAYRGELTLKSTQEAVSTIKAQPKACEPAQLPTVELESSPNPSLAGMPVTLTAVVSRSGPTSNGIVNFSEFGSTHLIGSVHTSTGTAGVSTNGLPVGQHAIRVSFSPDGSNLLSTSGPLIQIVNDPKDGETSTALALIEAHSDAPGRIMFTFRVKVSITKSDMPVVHGRVMLNSPRWQGIVLPLDTNGEAIFSASIPVSESKRFPCQAFFLGGTGLQASSSRLTLE